jgi:hypothetical protein
LQDLDENEKINSNEESKLEDVNLIKEIIITEEKTERGGGIISGIKRFFKARK